MRKLTTVALLVLSMVLVGCDHIQYSKLPLINREKELFCLNKLPPLYHLYRDRNTGKYGLYINRIYSKQYLSRVYDGYMDFSTPYSDGLFTDSCDAKRMILKHICEENFEDVK